MRGCITAVKVWMNRSVDNSFPILASLHEYRITFGRWGLIWTEKYVIVIVFLGIKKKNQRICVLSYQRHSLKSWCFDDSHEVIHICISCCIDNWSPYQKFSGNHVDEPLLKTVSPPKSIRSRFILESVDFLRCSLVVKVKLLNSCKASLYADVEGVYIHVVHNARISSVNPLQCVKPIKALQRWPLYARWPSQSLDLPRIDCCVGPHANLWKTCHTLEDAYIWSEPFPGGTNMQTLCS